MLMLHHVVAALIIQGDRVLLGRRSSRRTFYPNVWDVFGGHVEPGEHPVHTLIRELQEELNITPTEWTDLETIQESVPERDAARMPSQDLVVNLYCVTAWAGTPVNRQPEEHSVVQWFSYEEATRLDLAHSSYRRLFAQCLGTIKDHRP
jgi:8-oxo-dGTP pyrophosphatase MutT (NUDIX family)